MKTRITTTRNKVSSNLFLYVSCALIWGTTWLVIKFQINEASPLIGVFYRFILASAIMFGLHFVMKKSLRFPWKFHKIFILQGVTNFSLNYVITYNAQRFVPSAIVALTFTTLIHYNMLGSWLFFKKKIHQNVLFGGLLGAIGILFLFLEDINKMNLESQSAIGIGMGLFATIFASAGNLFSLKAIRMKVPVMAANAWGMFYGMISTGILCVVFQETFVFPTSASFWMSMFYLTILGTVVAFMAYVTLIGRIGAERAAYTSIASPVIAVGASVLFEGLPVTTYLLIGMIFCLVGNVLTLKKTGKLPAITEPPP